MNTRELQNEVVSWADSAFPFRSASSAFMKLFEELGEVIREPENGDEWADLLILILDLMAMHGHRNPAALVLAKLEVNHSRRWEMNHLGVMQHKE